MAQFSLSVINSRGSIVLTDYDTVQGKTAGLTFDERLNLTTDGSTLDFAMLKYLYEGSQKVVNTPAISLTYGSIIKCIVNGNRYDFAIVEISYQFLSENLQLQFSAQDYFQFENSQIGVGYTISADTTDPDYFGAQPIDAWVRKIIHDNNIRWGYIPINQANREWLNVMLTQQHRQFLFDTSIDEEGYWNLKDADATLNTWVSFECSNSSAYNALKQLASENDLTIVVDYANHNFWFAPTKNVIFNGYYFNPNNNLQSFSIRGNAQNLVTVLNITGPKDLDNQEITLVPTIPLELLSVIDSDEWLDTKYYPSLYTKYTNDAQFIREIAYTPWFENKLINISYFTDNNLILASEKQELMDTLYNKLRIINGRLIAYQRQYLTQYEQDYMQANQRIINCENVNASLYGDVDALYSLALTEQPICFATKDETTKPWVYLLPNFKYYASTGAEDILINADSINGALHDYLTSPELVPHYESTQYPFDAVATPTAAFQPFRIRHYGSGAALKYPLFVSNGNLITYYGTSLTSNGWRLTYKTGTTPTSGPHYFDIPSYCTNATFDISMSGPSIALHIYKNGTQWYGATEGDPKLISTDSSEPTKLKTQLGSLYIYYYGSDDTYAKFYVDISGGTVTGFGAVYVQNINGTISLCWQHKLDESTAESVQLVPSIVDDQLNFGIIFYTFPDEQEENDTNTTSPQDHTQITMSNAVVYSPQYRPPRANAPGAENGGNIEVRYYYQVVSGDIQHLQILKGPITIYGEKQNNSGTGLIKTNTIKCDDTLNGTYIFNSLLNALNYTGTSNKLIPSLDKSNAQPSVLNQLAGVRDNYYQTLAENCSKLLSLWNKTVDVQSSGGTYIKVTWGQFIIKYNTIGMLANGIDTISAHISSPDNRYSEVDDTKFVSKDIAILKAFLETDTLLRSEVVPFIQLMVTNITEKWQLCYNAAMGLGLYWPKDWNIINWLCKTGRSDNFIQYESSLLADLLPLVPSNWMANPISKDDLYLNTAFMPFIKDSQNWNYNGSWS